jgi:hypothetical protein
MLNKIAVPKNACMHEQKATGHYNTALRYYEYSKNLQAAVAPDRNLCANVPAAVAFQHRAVTFKGTSFL